MEVKKKKIHSTYLCWMNRITKRYFYILQEISDQVLLFTGSPETNESPGHIANTEAKRMILI